MTRTVGAAEGSCVAPCRGASTVCPRAAAESSYPTICNLLRNGRSAAVAFAAGSEGAAPSSAGTSSGQLCEEGDDGVDASCRRGGRWGRMSRRVCLSGACHGCVGLLDRCPGMVEAVGYLRVKLFHGAEAFVCLTEATSVLATSLAGPLGRGPAGREASRLARASAKVRACSTSVFEGAGALSAALSDGPAQSGCTPSRGSASPRGRPAAACPCRQWLCRHRKRRLPTTTSWPSSLRLASWLRSQNTPCAMPLPAVAACKGTGTSNTEAARPRPSALTARWNR